VFLFHWREELQHAILDELEWQREDALLAAGERDAAVDDLIALVGAVDGILQAQANADAGYFVPHWGGSLSAARIQRVRDAFLEAYRWQYIVSGVCEPRFQALVSALVTAPQIRRIREALQTAMSPDAAPRLATTSRSRSANSDRPDGSAAASATRCNVVA